jgi:anti-sigma factor RsiW
MIDRNSPVTEDELHVYVDGELPADRREAVELWLASHPEDAARVAAWRAQAEAIRSRYGKVSTNRCPAGWRSTASRASAARGARSRRPRRFSPSSSAASPAGWRAAHRPPRRANSKPSPTRRSARTGSTSARSASDRSQGGGEASAAVAVAAARHHIAHARSFERFDFKLLGGRLCPASTARRAVHVRERQRRASHALFREPDRGSDVVPLRSATSFGAIRWSEGGYGWVISGPATSRGSRPSPSASTSSSKTCAIPQPDAAAQLGRSTHIAARIVGLPVAPTCASVPRVPDRCARAARCARWRRDRRCRPCRADPCP